MPSPPSFTDAPPAARSGAAGGGRGLSTVPLARAPALPAWVEAGPLAVAPPGHHPRSAEARLAAALWWRCLSIRFGHPGASSSPRAALGSVRLQAEDGSAVDSIEGLLEVDESSTLLVALELTLTLTVTVTLTVTLTRTRTPTLTPTLTLTLTLTRSH